MKSSSLLLLLFSLSICVQAGSKAYQYYQPINDPEVEEFISKALKELSYFGDFAFPIKEIHLRHSKLREQPRLYSRADVIDWDSLEKVLTKDLNLEVFPGITKNIESQLAAIKGLNSLIKDEKLFKRKPFSGISLTEQQEKWTGKGFFGFFSEDHIKLNRSILDELLKHCVNSFKFIKRPLTGMQLCELADAKRGIYVIYLKHPIGSDAFYCELGHELFHTLDPTIYDWHMEGLANVFSKHLSTTLNFSWNHFKNILSETSKPYGASYHLINQVYQIRPESFRNFTRYKVRWKGSKSAIDSKKWLKTLNPQQKIVYKTSLGKFISTLKASPHNFIKIN